MTNKQDVSISKCFYETTTDIFTLLTGYEVGDVEVDEDCVITRFDKQVENVVISRRVMFDDDGISITDDYVLDILPKEKVDKHKITAAEKAQAALNQLQNGEKSINQVRQDFGLENISETQANMKLTIVKCSNKQ